jgi:hypothetical protein
VGAKHRGATTARRSATPWGSRPVESAVALRVAREWPRSISRGFEVKADLNLGDRFGGVSGILSGIRTDGFRPSWQVDRLFRPALIALARRFPTDSLEGAGPRAPRHQPALPRPSPKRRPSQSPNGVDPMELRDPVLGDDAYRRARCGSAVVASRPGSCTSLTLRVRRGASAYPNSCRKRASRSSTCSTSCWVSAAICAASASRSLLGELARERVDCDAGVRVVARGRVRV